MTLPQQPKIETVDEILEEWGGKELATGHGSSIWRHRVSDLRRLAKQARAAGFREGVEKAAVKMDLAAQYAELDGRPELQKHFLNLGADIRSLRDSERSEERQSHDE